MYGNNCDKHTKHVLAVYLLYEMNVESVQNMLQTQQILLTKRTGIC